MKNKTRKFLNAVIDLSDIKLLELGERELLLWQTYGPAFPGQLKFPSRSKADTTSITLLEKIHPMKLTQRQPIQVLQFGFPTWS